MLTLGLTLPPKEVTPPSIRLRQIEKSSGKGVLDDELPRGSAARAEFRIRIIYLQKFPRVEWTTKQFRQLKNGLSEVKWASGKVQVRALGYDDGNGYFVVVKVCEHKQSVYKPHDCIGQSEKMKKEAQQGKYQVVEYVL